MRVGAHTFDGLGRYRGFGFGDARPINSGGVYAVAGAPAGCPMLSDGTCGDPVNGSSPCSLYRECDSVTGAIHYEYQLPSGNVPNANIWSMAGDGSLVWLGPNGVPATPPASLKPPVNDPTLLQSVGNTDWWATWNKTKTALTPPSSNKPPVNTTTPPVQDTTNKTTAGGSGTGGSTSDKQTTTTTTLIPNVPDNYLYLGLAAVAAFFFFKR